MKFELKYKKYKQKYLDLKKQYGGNGSFIKGDIVKFIHDNKFYYIIDGK